MKTFQVVEKFVSINGEGKRAGELALFIRFKGCNLACSYCDTSWANEPDCVVEQMTKEEILDEIRKAGVRNITLTGGEPLLQEGIEELISLILKEPFYRIEIETNGSVDISRYVQMERRPSITMDYKLAESGMEEKMLLENLTKLSTQDSLKFVVSSRQDMERAYEIIQQYELLEKVTIFFSPVFGKIEPVEMVNFLMEHKLNDVKVQIQLHKVIWDPAQRGV